MMRGPMLQALLEDRFQVKVHRETRELAVYALTVAKNGLKSRWSGRLKEVAPPGISHRSRRRPGPARTPGAALLRL
jgi:uncharacterized protein (TIGR03435 family)